MINEKNGGEATINNLRTICKKCNKLLGTQNISEYMKQCSFDKEIKKEQIINKLFADLL